MGAEVGGRSCTGELATLEFAAGPQVKTRTKPATKAGKREMFGKAASR